MLVIEAKKRGVRLNPKDVRMVVGVCCDWGLVRLGMELLEWEEGGITGDGGTAGGEVLVAGWMDVLRASADLYFVSIQDCLLTRNLWFYPSMIQWLTHL